VPYASVDVERARREERIVRGVRWGAIVVVCVVERALWWMRGRVLGFLKEGRWCLLGE